MTRLPRVTSSEVLRKLLRAGFRVVRSSGGHVRVRNLAGCTTTIPLHSGKTLKPKTLATILHDAKLTIEAFRNL